MSLADWILAQLDADEATARAATAAPRPCGEGAAGQRWEQRDGSGMLYTPAVEDHADAALWDDEGDAPDVAAHIAAQDPAATLARCAALRAVVALHKPRERRSWLECVTCFDPDTQAGDYDFETWPCPTLRALAGAWAGRDGYDEAAG